MRPTLALVAAVMAASSANAIWPIPQHMSTGSGVMLIDDSVKVTYNGHTLHWSRGHSSDGQQIPLDYYAGNPFEHPSVTLINGQPQHQPLTETDTIVSAVERTFCTILQQGIVPWMLNPVGSNFEPDPNSDATDFGHAFVKSLAIRQTENYNSTGPVPLAGSLDESYELSLTLNGEASIKAATSTGVLRALETFSQLFYKHSSTSVSYTKLAPVLIQDFPRFHHRGMLLDLSRHWFAVDDIKRTIDGLAMTKMNMLHLHMTDTQSWPIEIPALPKLAEKGSLCPWSLLLTG